jgi:hypothetical protein
MGLTGILKPALFIYECVRIVFILFILTALLPDFMSFPLLVFASPAVMFPLMALFIWLNAEKNKIYLPLFLAGKSVNIFTLILWSILAGQDTIISNTTIFLFNIRLILLSGDFFSIAVILVILRNTQKKAEIPEDADENNSNS